MPRETLLHSPSSYPEPPQAAVSVSERMQERPEEYYLPPQPTSGQQRSLARKAVKRAKAEARRLAKGREILAAEPDAKYRSAAKLLGLDRGPGPRAASPAAEAAAEAEKENAGGRRGLSLGERSDEEEASVAGAEELARRGSETMRRMLDFGPGGGSTSLKTVRMEGRSMTVSRNREQLARALDARGTVLCSHLLMREAAPHLLQTWHMKRATQQYLYCEACSAKISHSQRTMDMGGKYKFFDSPVKRFMLPEEFRSEPATPEGDRGGKRAGVAGELEYRRLLNSTGPSALKERCEHVQTKLQDSAALELELLRRTEDLLGSLGLAARAAAAPPSETALSSPADSPGLSPPESHRSRHSGGADVW